MVGGASTDTHNLPAALPVREFPIYASDIIFDLNTFYSSSPLPICHRIVISKERRTLPSLSKSWNNARELSRILPWARRDFSNEKVNEWRGKPIFPGSIYFSIIFGGLQDGARLVRASYKLPSPPLPTPLNGAIMLLPYTQFAIGFARAWYRQHRLRLIP